ncbi:MAG: uracil-DNA glycosylase family protein [Pseudomonadota bacterium]
MAQGEKTDFATLRQAIAACRLCEASLPHGPRPVLQAHPDARVLIAGQAPGRKVHESGVPFDDPSGDRLRQWLGISREVFYDPHQLAIVPMGFCYPGTGTSGDLPPRPECAPAWRADILGHLTQVRLTLVIGQYAQKAHLPNAKGSLTDTVRRWSEFGPDVVPLPHPSPRNNRWLKKNPWFEETLLPELEKRVADALAR